jgi:hypothetical protein
MFKLLIWGIVGYVIYRYFQNKFGLIINKKDNLQGPNDNIRNSHGSSEAKKKGNESDYIDYEEIK